MFSPTLDEYAAMAARGERTALRRRIPADLETPVSAFLKLKPLGATFLLESVEQGIQVGRYSFIGISPYAVIKLQNETVEIRRGGDVQTEAVGRADPFEAVRRELARSATLTGDLPGPFAGAVGYMAYDIARYFEEIPLPTAGDLGLPDYQFLFPETLAVFDHVKSEIEILTMMPGGDPETAYAAAVARIETLLHGLESALHIESAAPTAPNAPTAIFNMEQADFEKRVRSAKEYILEGDTFQIVLSQRLQGQTETPPFQIYRALRILNPSPYMFFIDFGEFQVIGSSPEVLVKLEGRRATLCPIAGTRPRGETPPADENLAKELLADEKERAEHVMLVDLGRNDLGRVCEIGSVHTESLMHIEKYSHVMHIVSRITGILRADLDMFDLLRATFPAGTLSGAPKIRAMEIISELEGCRRGPYGGAVGYLGREGDMDLCIAIRTMIMQGTTYLAQAGAGIVADSDPAFEYRETLNKIKALTKAISLAEEGF